MGSVPPAVPPMPAGTPLTAQHAEAAGQLAAGLTAEEALWLSGYFAGVAATHGAARTAPEAEITPARLTILYGTETGHAGDLAERAEKLARERGLPVECFDLADYRASDIAAVRYLMLFASTHGEGDPPEGAAEFCEFLASRKAPGLEGMKFAVLGLGDSTYEQFCQTGKMLDRQLEALGATRIQGRADCDIDYGPQARDWIDAGLDAFAQLMQQDVPITTTPVVAVEQTQKASPAEYDAENPYPAPVLERLDLNGRGSDKQTLHLELGLADSGLGWEPGDAIGIMPENDPGLIEELCRALGYTGEEPVAADGQGELPLAQVLQRHYEVTALTPRFVDLYCAAAGVETMHELLDDEGSADLAHFIADRQIIDMVTEYPVKGLAPGEFVGMLRRLQPRLYSLASCYEATGGEAHLTVAVVRYLSRQRLRKGVASAYLYERTAIDATVPVHISRNKNFKLPADASRPIIMVAAGTGIAPFRAFLQARVVSRATGRSWLFFGDRRFRTDFLYQTEWQRALKDGSLTRMDVAFSRDQEEKIYVQHRLLEGGKEIWSWLQDGAHLYVCGDAAKMAPDVHGALTAIVAEEGGMSAEKAEEYVKQLQRDKRYQRDVY